MPSMIFNLSLSKTNRDERNSIDGYFSTLKKSGPRTDVRACAVLASTVFESIKTSMLPCLDCGS